MEDVADETPIEGASYSLNNSNNSLFAPSNLLFRQGAKSEIKSKLDTKHEKKQRKSQKLKGTETKLRR